MNYPSACLLLLVAGFASAALGEAPVEPPVIPSSIVEESIEEEPPVDSSLVGSNQQELPRLNEFQGDETGLVFRTLARQGSLNVVVSDKAAADTVTMRLENKTPKEAIEVIVQDKGLLMDEINGVCYIRTLAEAAKEPAANALGRITNTVVGPLAKMKGEYYRQLLESGIPEATASAIIVSEQLSHATLANPPAGVPSETSTSARLSEASEWLSWTIIGSVGFKMLMWAPLLALHFALAVAVWATARRDLRAEVKLAYFSPFLWAFATLIGGVFIAALYWLMHHSSLRPQVA